MAEREVSPYGLEHRCEKCGAPAPYRPTCTQCHTTPTYDFGWAIAALKEGDKVTRLGWNGRGMFIYLVPGSQFEVNRAPLLGIYDAGTRIDYRPHIDMKDAEGKCVPWLASQTDMLAEDWVLVP